MDKRLVYSGYVVRRRVPEKAHIEKRIVFADVLPFEFYGFTESEVEKIRDTLITNVEYLHMPPALILYLQLNELKTYGDVKFQFDELAELTKLHFDIFINDLSLQSIDLDERIIYRN